jgi:hypothetical protein
MGRHVPRLSFLSIVLSDEDALTPAEDFYHRLLTPAGGEELEFAESYLKSHSLTALYDAVFIPTLTSAETDARLDLLDSRQLGQLEQTMREIVEDLGTRPAIPEEDGAVEAGTAVEVTAAAAPLSSPDCRVFCLPARANRDEIAGMMLVQLLRQQGFGAQNAPGSLVTGELLGLVEKADVDVICISVVEPTTVIHARYLCLKLRALSRKEKIVVGLWGATVDVTDAALARLRRRRSGHDARRSSRPGRQACSAYHRRGDAGADSRG